MAGWVGIRIEAFSVLPLTVHGDEKSISKRLKVEEVKI